MNCSRMLMAKMRRKARMKAEWIDLCRCDGFRIDGNFVEVIFANERRQRVCIEDQADAYRLFSVAARAAKLGDLSNPALVAWERNRSLSLMGLRVDDRGRMIGGVFSSTVGLF